MDESTRWLATLTASPLGRGCPGKPAHPARPRTAKCWRAADSRWRYRDAAVRQPMGHQLQVGGGRAPGDARWRMPAEVPRYRRTWIISGRCRARRKSVGTIPPGS